MKSDVEISREASLLNINEVSKKLGIPSEYLENYGHYKAKIDTKFIDNNKKNGRLILVTAMSPTPAGEGKTTTTVGLGDALSHIGKKTVICLREPSLGPCFGMKGGGTGGGYAQVVPMDDINLHFTGDFHAITSAHNLLSALIDNHIHWDNKLNIDPRMVVWNRVLDINDRALRRVVTGLGGKANGMPKESGFDITVASEVMAIFCLSKDLQDLEKRLGNITIAYNCYGKPVFAKDIKAHRPMAVLLKDAFKPNLVQTIEHTPAFVHGGPFANIAHGCNSVVSTKLGLKLADYVVTEAGFGSDLGAEKFFDIKCRKSGLKPDVVVLVATIRALKMHGGVDKSNLDVENVEAVTKGCANLVKHIRNLSNFGVSIIVALNHFHSDTDDEFKVVQQCCNELNTEVYYCSHWADGSKGTENLAKAVVNITNSEKTSQFKTLYDDSMPLIDKVRHIARTIYGADDIIADKKIRQKFDDFQKSGYGNFPVCIAKTQYSFSTDNNLLGAPTGHKVPIQDIKLSTGAEFVVIICGSIMTMPGLPRVPSADNIFINEKNQIEGLF